MSYMRSWAPSIPNTTHPKLLKIVFTSFVFFSCLYLSEFYSILFCFLTEILFYTNYLSHDLFFDLGKLCLQKNNSTGKELPNCHGSIFTQFLFHAGHTKQSCKGFFLTYFHIADYPESVDPIKSLPAIWVQLPFL